MTKKKAGLSNTSSDTDNIDGFIWPSENYSQQLERLQNFIGETIYLVELSVTDINVGVHHSDRGYVLLDIMEYPQPDPKSHLYPHFVLLDDGRGINLGRIEQISIEQAFNPKPRQIVYRDKQLFKKLLPYQNRFSNESVKLTSQHALADIAGHSFNSDLFDQKPMISKSDKDEDK